MKSLLTQAAFRDLELLLRIHQVFTGRNALRFFRALSRSADGWAGLFLPLILASLNPGAAREELIATAAAFALELPLYKILKLMTRRLRPFEACPRVPCHLLPPDRFAFPSGHTAGAFVCVTVTAAFAPMLVALLLPWALAVAVSRVALGVHFPSDTAAGAMLGCLCGSAGIALASAL